jgi:hypothetical protein
VHRLVAAIAAFAFLASASSALADGPGYISQGGPGVLAHNGKTRFVAVPAGTFTAIERVRVRGGLVAGWNVLEGGWGVPSPTVFRAEGLTSDGGKFILQSSGLGSPTRFAVVDTRTLQVVDRFMLKGSFAYDALSPDASTLYLIQHVASWNFNRYVVRRYNLRTHTLDASRIADKKQRGWVMDGSALTRTTSAGGRWVYTLYQRPGGYPFIHALDTVSGTAHCIGVPWTGDQTPLWNVRLTLTDDGKTLAMHWKSGRSWLTMNTTSWRLTHVHPSGLPWRWLLAGAGVAFALVLVVGAATITRRHQTEAAPVPL